MVQFGPNRAPPVGGLYVDVYLPRVRLVLGSPAMEVPRFESLYPYLTPLLVGGWARRFLSCVVS
jgi:hypothetical protein